MNNLLQSLASPGMRLLLFDVMDRLFEVVIVEELDFAKLNPQGFHAISQRCEIHAGKNTLMCVGKPSYQLNPLAGLTKPRSLTYHIYVLDKAERAIRVFEVEAEMNEAQAKRFAELASYVNSIEYKLKLEALSSEALEKAVEITGSNTTHER